MKGIDDGELRGRVGDVRNAQEKVSRKIHPIDVKAGAMRDFEVNHCQADRYSCSTLEHLVDEAVARVVVPLAVADEVLLVVQVLIEYPNRVAARLLNPERRFFSHLIE